MSTHQLKVVAPYFEALLDDSKGFEVRKNDRAYQRGDVLELFEFDPDRCFMSGQRECTPQNCVAYTGRSVMRTVSFVYSGDPRFGGVERGYVVLSFALAAPVSIPDKPGGQR